MIITFFFTIHRWIIEILIFICTCSWLNMKTPCYLFLDFSLGLLNLWEIVGCKVVKVCHHRHKLPAVCLPSVLKELQLLKKPHPNHTIQIILAKCNSNQYVNSLRYCKPTFVCDDFYEICQIQTASRWLFSWLRNIDNTKFLTNLANISCTQIKVSLHWVAHQKV